MRFIAFLAVVMLAAFIVAALFTANSNYLDGNINKNLDLTKSLQLHGSFTEDDIAANNTILACKLNVMEKASIILAEMNKYKNPAKYDT
uniref:Wsv321-like protein n=1 Tax=Pasiphaea japonica whispovirus TaxID=2984286 RepID=A0A9C7BNL9_9VIRU|nr:MAG: wsv321-like protein [Pasiphaea japonica whispovirus]